MADPQTADLVILGGGSGGYACALRAAELDLSVIMIERDKVGGTCLHRGCIPTKALLHAAEVADAARDGEKVGVRASLEGIDMAGRQRLQGRGRRPALQGPDRAGEEPQHHGRRRLRAADVAHDGRGRRHARTPPPGRSCSPPARTRDRCPASSIDGERIITSEHALDPRPRAGVGRRARRRRDRRRVRQRLALVRRGGHDRRGAPPPGADRGGVELEAARAGVPPARHQLLARRPLRRGQGHRHRRHGHPRGRQDLRRRATARRGRSRPGLGRASGTPKPASRWTAASSPSTPTAGPTCRTSTPIGDLRPGLQLAHVGFGEGIMVAEQIAGLNPPAIDYDGVPRVTYCEPEVASVGLTSAQAKERGYDIVEATYDLAGNGRGADPADRRRGQGDRREGRPGARHPHGRLAGRRPDRRGAADHQLGGAADRGRAADPPAPHPVRGGRRGPSRAGRQTPSQPTADPDPTRSSHAMSVSVTMPRLGESVSEGTVTRWLKAEGEHVDADEPLLEVSTDKVDTEIPSPASGVLTSDQGRRGRDGRRRHRARADRRRRRRGRPQPRPRRPSRRPSARARSRQPAPAPAEPRSTGRPSPRRRTAEPAPAPAPAPAPRRRPRHAAAPPAAAPAAAATERPTMTAGRARRTSRRWSAGSPPSTASTSPTSRGTGVGGRIRKQDVIDAAGNAPAAAARRSAAPAGARAERHRLRRSPAAPAPARPPRSRDPDAPHPVRGSTEKLSRLRQVIAERMTESLRISAQLTTVVEADLTRIARLRDRAKADFEAREGVKLTLPAVLRARHLRGAARAPGRQLLDRPRGRHGHLPRQRAPRDRGRHPARPARPGAAATPATSTWPGSPARSTTSRPVPATTTSPRTSSAAARSR